VENPDTTGATYNRLKITETRGATSTVHEYEWVDTEQAWVLSLAGGLRKERKESSYDSVLQNRTDTFTVLGSSNEVVSKTVEVYHTFAWGEELIQEVNDPDGRALTTTHTYYDNSTTDGNNYGHLKQTVDARGHWQRFEYDAEGRQTKRVVQFLDNAVGSAENLNRVYTTAYQETAPQETILEYLKGQEIGRRYESDYGDQYDGTSMSQSLVAQAAGDTDSDPDNLTTTTWILTSGDDKGKTAKRLNPDGTMALYTYATDTLSGTLVKVVTVTEGEPNTAEDDIIQGTRAISKYDESGTLLEQTTLDIDSSLVTSSMSVTARDALGRPTEKEYLDGSTETITYTCCGIESVTDRDGVTTSYIYDALKRRVSEARANVVMVHAYDAAGRVVESVRMGSDASQMAQETRDYDVSGELLSSETPLGETVYTVTTDGSGHEVRTTTYADGGTRVETFYKDGALLSVTGTAVHPQKYAYDVDATYGAWTKTILLGSANEETEWSKTYSDLVGRSYRTAQADGAVEQSIFNSKGQLIRRVDADGVAVLFAYDGQGRQQDTVLDINQNSAIDLTGSDRIVRTVRDVATAHSTTVQRATVTEYTETGTVVSSIEERSADGLQSWLTRYGLVTQTQAVRDPANERRTETTTLPDGTQSVVVYEEGRLKSQTRKNTSGGTMTSRTLAYDPHGRVLSETDARTGTTTFTYNSADLLTEASGDGRTTGADYDVMGRRILQILPDEEEVHTEYFLTGDLKKTYGARTYTVEYTYDAQGRMKTLATATGTTQWSYSASRGLLAAKSYPDGKGTDYTYWPSGRLKTRVWERGITATYGYNTAGDPASIDYSDSTPDVAYGYDRRGRQTSVAAGGTTLTYTLNTAGLPLTETYTGTLLDGKSLTRTYDTLLRPSTAQASGGAPAVAYTYAATTGRLQEVGDGTHSVAYGYLANSDLLETSVFKRSGSTVMTTTRTHDVFNRLSGISSTRTGKPALGFTYQYNTADQRTRVDLADGTYWEYGYDALGQVVSGRKYTATDAPVPGMQWDYAFDGIGNRTSEERAEGGTARTSTYTHNNLNQYTQRTVPGFLDLWGQAQAGATVTVNNQPVAREGGLFYKDLAVSNAAAAVHQQVDIVGVRNNAGVNGEDAVQQQSGQLFLPKTPEIFTYDDDGNLLSDGRWNYTWDGENRLTRLETKSGLPGPRQRLDFAYDGLSRRIQKKVSLWNSGSGSFALSETRSYIYDGWNPMTETIELAAGGTSEKRYVWGLDVSGSLQGAGGVGGLVFAGNAGSASWCPAYDGNGNVMNWVDTQNAETQATFEYGPFGEPVRAEGSGASTFTFRFSTKYTDKESGLLYYGYRFYNLSTGRWLSRDPMEERGGLNLYGMVDNSPINFTDYLGLAYGKHLTKDEAKSLACALKFWLSDAKDFNSIFGWGEWDYSYTLKFLDHYLGKSGKDQTVQYSDLRNDGGIQKSNDSARMHFSYNQNPFLISGLRLEGDLGFAVGRVNIYYESQTDFKTKQNRLIIHAKFKDEFYKFHDIPASKNFPGLERSGIFCCWNGGEDISGTWMLDLEKYGFAKRFNVHAEWWLYP
jgi:RHS repeat-associated protein